MKAITRRQLRFAAGLLCAVGASFAQVVGAHSTELDLHGSLAQGYAWSDGNNYFGESTDGSRDLYEVALNATTRPHPKLLLSGQLMARRSGSTDDGVLRVDYLQANYKAFTGADASAGLRIGKLKNPYGFYNASRDVVFSRPGITMPGSVYFTNLGLRDLLFSTESSQLYGGWRWGQSTHDLVVGVAPTFDATKTFRRSFGLTNLDGRIKVRDFHVAQWLQEWDLGRIRSGLSYLSARLTLEPEEGAPPQPVDALTTENYVLSLQWQGAQYSATFEYLYSDSATHTLIGTQRSAGDGGYLQVRSILNKAWNAYLRYDLRWPDRNDRDGRRYAQNNPGQPRHQRFSRDASVGLSWKPAPEWGLFAEVHYIDGTAQVSPLENQGRNLDRYSTLGLVMIGYRF